MRLPIRKYMVDSLTNQKDPAERIHTEVNCQIAVSDIKTYHSISHGRE